MFPVPVVLVQAVAVFNLSGLTGLLAATLLSALDIGVFDFDAFGYEFSTDSSLSLAVESNSVSVSYPTTFLERKD